ncbi:DCTN6 protein, partial [Polyodon spathula]|nr:DCTN6 protein [Polyodon spathula]
MGGSSSNSHRRRLAGKPSSAAWECNIAAAHVESGGISQRTASSHQRNTCCAQPHFSPKGRSPNIHSPRGGSRCIHSPRRGSQCVHSPVSQAMKIGDNNVVESKGYFLLTLFYLSLIMFCLQAEVGRNVILTSGCIIGACCQVNTCEVIPENTVIYGSGCMRRVQTERPQPQTLQLDFLMKILPNYHHLKKTLKGNSTPAKN